jgi:hypothetical protein
LVTSNPLLVASIAILILKTCLEFAAKLTDSSQDFSRLPFPQRNTKGGISGRPAVLKILQATSTPGWWDFHNQS